MCEVKIYELDHNSKKAHIIAGIHKSAFTDFFLTQLGTNFLTTLYQGYIEDPESGIIVAESEKRNQVLGFIAYSKDYSGFYSRLQKKHLFAFAYNAATVAIKHPSFMKRLLGAFKKSDEVKRPEKYVELASIGVKPEAQGTGIGGKLVDYLLSIVDFDGYEYVSLETDAVDNEVVNCFYIKKRFKLAREYVTSEGRQMNEYRYFPQIGETF